MHALQIFDLARAFQQCFLINNLRNLERVLCNIAAIMRFSSATKVAVFSNTLYIVVMI